MAWKGFCEEVIEMEDVQIIIELTVYPDTENRMCEFPSQERVCKCVSKKKLEENKNGWSHLDAREGGMKWI